MTAKCTKEQNHVNNKLLDKLFELCRLENSIEIPQFFGTSAIIMCTDVVMVLIEPRTART